MSQASGDEVTFDLGSCGTVVLHIDSPHSPQQMTTVFSQSDMGSVTVPLSH